MSEWTATYGDAETVLEALYDVELVDTFNPYGDYAVLKLDDVGGQLFDELARGTWLGERSLIFTEAYSGLVGIGFRTPTPNTRPYARFRVSSRIL